jgi:N-carbamoylputrescine amidase
MEPPVFALLSECWMQKARQDDFWLAQVDLVWMEGVGEKFLAELLRIDSTFAVRNRQAASPASVEWLGANSCCYAIASRGGHLTDKFRVGLVQMSTTPDPEKNLQRAVDRLHQAAAKGAQIVCLPELFQTQYFCQREDAALFDLAEPIPGPTTARLSEVAKQLRIVLVASLFEKRAPGVYHNTAVMIDSDGSLRGIYRKMHIPDDPLYYEKFYFTPGDLGFKAFDTQVGRVGTLVCWDQWYPEGARLTTLQGAQVLFYPTAIGWHPAEKEQFGAAQHDAWQTIQRAHAIANGVYVAVVNRVGFEEGDIRGNKAPGKGLEFWGGSFLADPFGRVIANASHDKEEILVGEVDLRALEDIRRNWPFLRDRRIDAYAPITSRLID